MVPLRKYDIFVHSPHVLNTDTALFGPTLQPPRPVVPKIYLRKSLYLYGCLVTLWLSLADAPGALFTEVMSRRAEMDMQVKMREDPLYAIRYKLIH